MTPNGTVAVTARRQPPGWRVVCWILAGLPAAAAGAESALGSLAKIHALSREVAALGQPVKSRGIVTFVHPDPLGDFVIEDEAAGVFVNFPQSYRQGPLPAPGALVEVTGITGAGGYAPIVLAQRVDVIGKAWLPVAQPVSVNQLLTGRFDSRRVEIRGIVQYATHRTRVEQFGLELAGEFGRISVYALESGGMEPVDLIDAEVTVRAVCFPFFNERAEVAGVRLEMMNAREIEINRPPRSEPFAAPLVGLHKLQPFSPEGLVFHRQRIQGTVTLVVPGQFLYLQDDHSAVRVNLSDEVPVMVGDRVEAVGFAEVRTRFVEWQRALVRKLGVAPVPAPIAITRDQVLSPRVPAEARTAGDHDGRLVSLTGRLDKIESLPDGNRQLFMDCDGQVVTAMLHGSEVAGRIDALRVGSQIGATGICVVDYSDNWPTLGYVVPTGMRVLLRGPDDIRLLQVAAWWTPARLRLALGVGAAVLLASLAWVGSLRRQVVRRTTELASEIRTRRDVEVESDATLRERERVAVDLHDTVEQALTGVAYQLVVAEALHRSEPQRSLQHLALSQQLLAQSREEVRRSVWNLRAQALNGRTLAEVLRDVTAGLAARHPVVTRVTVTGEERELPEFIAGHLLLLAQEAMTNAIKHANPGNIDLTLEFDLDSVELRVQDDGTGFDPSQAPGLTEGHLGLQGMRERMKRLGGEVRIASHPDQGTVVRARVPLPA